jgi:small-conductance mechanosensitive channel
LLNRAGLPPAKGNARFVTNLSVLWKIWLWPLVGLAIAIALSLLLHKALFTIWKRFASRTGDVVNNSLVHHAERPTRLIFPLFAILFALPALPVTSDWVMALRRMVGLGVIATFAWGIKLLSSVLGDTLFARYRLDIGDNLTARRVRTQISVLQRIFNVVLVVLAAGFMLMTFPEIRQLGSSVLASAGLVGLAVGIAMRPTLTNLIAGLQIAVTQPIRIEDVVIVEGDWGWIEEILTTYVVVRTWDLRRLIVPLSYFIDHVFQNWTRRTSDLLAYVYLYCDYTVPVEELRREFRRLVESTSLWDQKVCVLQISDTSEHTVQVRALTSASDSSKAWDLRCYVREGLIRFLQEKYPESLPKTRAELRSPRNDQAAIERAPFPGSRENADGHVAEAIR